MANTKIPVELSSTPGIVDNSDATAITIDSSENILIGTTTINSGTLGTSNKFLEVSAGTASGSGTLILSRNTSTNNVELGGVRFVNANNADDDGLDADGKLVAAVSARSVTSDSNAGDDSGADLIFYTKPEAGNYAERGRFLSSGGLTFNGDTAAVNALDDYEEGSWTPTLPNGGTVTVRTATYTKVGRHVMAYMYCQFAPTNNSSTFNIGGLPYTVVNNSNYYGGGSLSYSGTEDTSSFSDPLTHYNANFIYFHYLTGSSLSIKNSQFGGRTINLILQVHYETAA